MNTKVIITLTTKELIEYYKKQALHPKYGVKDVEYEIIIDDITPQEIEKNKEITNRILDIPPETYKPFPL